MTDLDVSEWPLWLSRFADVIGPERTLLLAQRFGSLDPIYLPKAAHARHLWLRVLTYPEFEALCERFGGQLIAFPRTPERNDGKKRRIIDLIEAGVSNRDIAIEVGTAQRHVRRIRELLGKPQSRTTVDPRQTTLFD